MNMKLQILVFLPILFRFGHSMHCLVTRPGYGLVSEQCPSSTVACRIRIDHNAVEYYEYSPLYDRNQFVCVLRSEYGDIKESGCVKKRTGKVRCWCFGRANCNTPEDSKKLYEAFQSGDQNRLREVVEEIDFPNLRNDDPSEISSTTIPSTTSTHQATKTTEQREKLGPRYSSENAKSSVSNYGVLKINNLPTDSQGMSKSRSKTHHHKKHHHHTTTTTKEPEETTILTTTEGPALKEHVYKSPIIKVTKDRKQSAFIPIAANSPSSSFSKPIVRPPPRHFEPKTTTTQLPTTTKKVEDVKVIYVNSKDKYENVIGSPEFRKALHLDEENRESEAHRLPTDKKKTSVHRHADPFNTEYNEEDSLEGADDDPLGDLPMSEQEADIYLNDEGRIPRVRTRSKDLDEYASSSAYYDSTLMNSASKLFGNFVYVFISTSFSLKFLCKLF